MFSYLLSWVVNQLSLSNLSIIFQSFVFFNLAFSIILSFSIWKHTMLHHTSSANLYIMLLLLPIMLLIVNPAMTNPEPQTQELINKKQPPGGGIRILQQNFQWKPSISIDRYCRFDPNNHRTGKDQCNQHAWCRTPTSGEYNQRSRKECSYRMQQRVWLSAEIFPWMPLPHSMERIMTTSWIWSYHTKSTRTLWSRFHYTSNPLNPVVERNREMRILIAMALVTGCILVSISI